MILLPAGLGIAAKGSASPPAGFPVYKSGTPYWFETQSASHGVTLPTTANGDLLIVQLGVPNGSITAPGGVWSALANDATGSVAPMRLVYKICDGTEGGTTLTVSNTGNTRMAAIAHLIQSGTFDASTPPEASTANGSSTTPDPPSRSASWGSDDNLFIAVCNARGYGNTQAFTYPYANNNVSAKSGANTGNAYNGCASCTLNSTNAAENPAAFGNSGSSVSDSWKAFTVVVRPA